MLDHEWPARKANFERWLSPKNFDPSGKQIASLSAMNGQSKTLPLIHTDDTVSH
jgi:hypothetical protein